MTEQLRAELLKIRSTRTTIGLVLGMILLVLLFSLLSGFLMPLDQLAQQDNQRQMLASGETAILFSTLVGLLLVTSEFRYGTIRPSLLFQPHRGRLIGSKLLAGLLVGLAFGIVGEGLALGIGIAVLNARGVDRLVTGGDLAQLALGGVGVTALWAALGVAIGTIVRHQVGAVVGLLAYLFIAENLLFGLVPKVGRYLPGPAGEAFVGSGADHLVAPAWGAVLLVGYVAAFAAGAVVLMQRRDVE